MAGFPDAVLNRALAAERPAPGFVVVHNALTDLAFSALQASAAAATEHATRTRFLGRKGGAVPFPELRRDPTFEALYTHPQFVRLVERASGSAAPLRPLPPAHGHACSLLVYSEEGDSIPYHYDRNYYRGRTFTVLLTLVNRDASALRPSANATCVWRDGADLCRSTAPNSLVVMHGQSVLHKAEPLGRHERRVVLSMVYSTDPSQSPLQAARQRVKDWSWGF